MSMRSRNRKNVWERLRESTEGPNVTLQVPRAWAEDLLRSIATALEVEDGGDGDMDIDMSHDEPDDDDLGGLSDNDEDDMPFSMGDDDVDPGFSSGDDDDDDMLTAGDEDDDDAPAPKGAKGRGRPPGVKNKKKDADDDDSDDDDEDKDEAIDPTSSVRPQTALGESRKRGPVLSTLVKPKARRR